MVQGTIGVHLLHLRLYRVCVKEFIEFVGALSDKSLPFSRRDSRLRGSFATADLFADESDQLGVAVGAFL